MKTTLELSDELLIQAKKRAVEIRRPLKELVEKGLRLVLKQRGQYVRRPGNKIKWITSGGGMPKNLKLESRENMHDWLKSES